MRKGAASLSPSAASSSPSSWPKFEGVISHLECLTTVFRWVLEKCANKLEKDFRGLEDLMTSECVSYPQPPHAHKDLTLNSSCGQSCGITTPLLRVYMVTAWLRHSSALRVRSAFTTGAGFSAAPCSKCVAASMISAAERGPTSQTPIAPHSTIARIM